ncbi:DJ-1/PfpI family protein [Winogradskyella sp.]|uniref:DJ-1/PfpI family protein n=1 Tax=Winogradskyella sp. TaxID=1883156 RepID=UPI003BA9CC62
MKYILLIFSIILCVSCNKTIKANDGSEQTSDKTIQIDSDTLAMSHDEIMKSVNIQSNTIKTIGILVYDGVNSLDVFGPKYVLNQIMGVDLKLIAVDSGHVKTVMGLEFVPNTTIAQVDSLDILVIPGGFRGTIEATKNENILNWIKSIDKTTTYTASVCTGGWILGSTGLLEGKKATTNWFKAEEMLASFGAEFTNERFTRDGKYWTSAGVTAGMDMALAMLVEIAGEDYAQGVMLDMEYDPYPPIEGGSPEKTKPEVLEFMTSMYEAGFNDIMSEL